MKIQPKVQKKSQNVNRFFDVEHDGKPLNQLPGHLSRTPISDENTDIVLGIYV